MRTLIRAGMLGAGFSAALLCAPAAQAAPHGDNGTVKIHDAKTGEVPRRNEPHVCTFYLDAFGFDAVQQVDWHIEAWAPTAQKKGETVKSGAITLDADGHGRTTDMSLPDGHYKLFWNFDGEKGAAKHKVFWTDCSGSQGGGGGTPSGKPSGSAPASPSPSSSSPSTAASSPAPSASSSSPGGATTPAPSASPSAPGGGLAETGNGVPVGLVSGAAAVLVGAGGYLVARRRRAVRG